MNDKLLEQVSALADDELDAREAALLLERMSRDNSLRDAWERYHLVGEALRKGVAPGSIDLAARVATLVEHDSPENNRRLVSRHVLAQLRPVAGLAIAASVAMVAVFTLQAPMAPSEVVPVAGNPPATVPLMTPQRADFSGVRSPELQDQLRSYLLNHSEHSRSARLRGGVMPYVQIAAQDTRPVEVVEEDPEAVKAVERKD